MIVWVRPEWVDRLIKFLLCDVIGIHILQKPLETAPYTIRGKLYRSWKCHLCNRGKAVEIKED